MAEEGPGEEPSQGSFALEGAELPAELGKLFRQEVIQQMLGGGLKTEPVSDPVLGRLLLAGHLLLAQSVHPTLCMLCLLQCRGQSSKLSLPVLLLRVLTTAAAQQLSVMVEVASSSSDHIGFSEA